MDAQTRKANAERIETLKIFRDRIEENNTLVKDLVRRDVSLYKIDFNTQCLHKHFNKIKHQFHVTE